MTVKLRSLKVSINKNNFAENGSGLDKIKSFKPLYIEIFQIKHCLKGDILGNIFLGCIYMVCDKTLHRG